MVQRLTRKIGDQELILETGKIGKQANGCVYAQIGGTAVIATVCASSEAKEGLDFVPVTVEYNESPEIHLNTHQGQEFHYCLECIFQLQIGDHIVTVEPGDSAYFDSRQPHGMRALNGKCAKILVITI